MVKLNKLPLYMDVGDNKIYRKQWLCSILDDNRVSALLCCGAQKKLLRDLCAEITKNAHVLQIGIAFGNEISAVYDKVHKLGKMDVFDVSQTQISMAAERYKNTDIAFTNYDAILPWDEKYDVVICYNLLHELPLKTRQKVMDNVLNSLTKGGKAIFIDCAEPHSFHPLKWLLFIYNRLYRPFAESLWQKSPEEFCSAKNEYRWNHSYYQLGRYQKTVAVRKILSNEDVTKLTKMFK